jgi:glycerophosphoryl diester phosphodiesterase
LKDGGDPNSLFDNDIGREAILPFLKKQTDFANDESYFGYPVLNGDKITEKYILKYKVSEGDHVVIASDGYPKLFPTLEESESYLEKVLKNDPLSINENIQTKMTVKGNFSFDDRSYLNFIVE